MCSKDDVSKIGDDNRRAFFEALFDGDVTKLKETIEGVDVNAPLNDGYTPLHIAAQHGKVSCIDLLIEHGAVLDACDTPQGNTPLHLACNEDKLDSVKVLCKNGALTQKLNENRCTPLDIVFEQKSDSKNEQIKKYLLKSFKSDTISNVDIDKDSAVVVFDGYYATSVRADFEISQRNEITIPLVFRWPKPEKALREWQEFDVLQRVPKHHSVINLSGICKAFEFEDKKIDALVVPLQKGGSLKSWVQKQKGIHSPRTLLDIGSQMAKAVRHLHKSGFVHNDIALRNFLLSVDPSFRDRDEGIAVILADFGAARPIGDEIKPEETPFAWRWCAPEVLRSKGTEVSVESDVWSLGIAFWEMIGLSSIPFGNISRWEDLSQHLEEHRSDVPLTFPKYIPAKWKLVVQQCCDYHAMDRITMDQLVPILETMEVDSNIDDPFYKFSRSRQNGVVILEDDNSTQGPPDHAYGDGELEEYCLLTPTPEPVEPTEPMEPTESNSGEEPNSEDLVQTSEPELQEDGKDIDSDGVKDQKDDSHDKDESDANKQNEEAKEHPPETEVVAEFKEESLKNMVNYKGAPNKIAILVEQEDEIGITIKYRNYYWTVFGVDEGSIADDAHIIIGDRITKIGDDRPNKEKARLHTLLSQRPINIAFSHPPRASRPIKKEIRRKKLTQSRQKKKKNLDGKSLAKTKPKVVSKEIKKAPKETKPDPNERGQTAKDASDEQKVDKQINEEEFTEIDLGSDDENFSPFGTFSGYLFKKNPRGVAGMHIWKKRFCVITETSFDYYGGPTDAAPKGKIQFRQIKQISKSDDVRELGRRFHFDMKDSDRVFEFRARGSQLADKWLNHIVDKIGVTMQ